MEEMKIAFEQSLLQNDAFSATIISIAVKAYYDQTEQKHGMPWALGFLILPLVYHKETAETCANKRRPSILPKVIAENKNIPLGVQDRLEKMTDMSMAGLRLAVASGSLTIDDDGVGLEIVPVGKLPPAKFVSEKAKTMKKAARVIGYAFAEVTIEQLGEFLLVRF